MKVLLVFLFSESQIQCWIQSRKLYLKDKEFSCRDITGNPLILGFYIIFTSLIIIYYYLSSPILWSFYNLLAVTVWLYIYTYLCSKGWRQIFHLFHGKRVLYDHILDSQGSYGIVFLESFICGQSLFLLKLFIANC